MKLSPQKEIIVGILRDRNWHCGSEWLNRIKDDRIRISELNKGYMLEKGYVIKGEPCKGRFCGRTKCPLDARKAVPLTPLATQQSKDEREAMLAYSRELVRRFDAGEPVFSVV